MKTLAQIDDDLHSWDKWEDIRDDYRNGSYTAYFYNKATGRDIKKAIHANSREELKKILLAEARSFEPDPDDHRKVMREYFNDRGIDWMTRGSQPAGRSMTRHASILVTTARSPGMRMKNSLA